MEVSYLAGQLSWNADYVLTINRDETKADLDGWVTLVNNSGTAFQNARLQLVAGELNRVPLQAQAKALGEFADQGRSSRGPRRSSRKPSANITCTRWTAAPAC